MVMEAEVLLDFVLFIISVLIIALLSFSQTRTRRRLEICNGRPGVVFAINFLNPRHRLVYTVTCAAQSSLWLGLLTSTWGLDTSGNKWISLFVKAILVLLFVGLVVILTYPMLACVESPIPILGYILGLLYSLTYLIMRSYIILSPLSNLSDYDSSFKAVIIGRTVSEILPETICIVIVISWYVYKLIKEVRRIVMCGEFWKMAIFEQPASMNHRNYVKHLLRKKQDTTIIGKAAMSYYNIPLPILIVTGVSAVVVFRLLIFTVVFFPYLFKTLASPFEDISIVLADISNGLTAVLVLAPILSTVLTVLLYIHLLYVIRCEMINIRRGRSQLNNSIRSVTRPSLKLTSFVRYAGYQTAAIITGWMFYSIVFFIIGVFFTGLVTFPDLFGYILYFFFVMTLVVGGAVAIEALMCKFIFILPESNQERTIIVNNRRVFNIFIYAVFLYNVATGLYTSTIRLIMAFLTALLLKPRLDRIIFISPFQLLDTGHSMYKSFMITEALLHNPVVHVFIQLLSQKSPTMKTKQGYVCSTRARNRWYKAYTLINNGKLLETNSSYFTVKMKSNDGTSSGNDSLNEELKQREVEQKVLLEV